MASPGVSTGVESHQGSAPHLRIQLKVNILRQGSTKVLDDLCANEKSF